MKNSMLIAILLAISGCIGGKEIAATELYNDQSGLCVKAKLPDEWSGYKEIPAFLDEDLVCQSIKGAKDTSSWMVLNIYEFKSAAQNLFDIDSILNWQINLAQTENSTTNLLDRRTLKQSSGKVIGFFDFSIKHTNRLDYSRFLVFYQGKKIGILELHNRGNQDAFLKIFNPITATLDY